MHNIILEPFAEGFVYLEGLRVHEGHLWVSDMVAGGVHRFGADGLAEKVVDVAGRPSGLGFLPDGTPLVVSMTERKVYRIVDSALELHADLSSLTAADLNDMLVDAEGRAYVGGFGYDFFSGAPAEPTDLIAVSPDGSATHVAPDLAFPNGMVLIDGGRTLVVAETWVGRLTAFDRDDHGALSNRRVYADLSGRTPDGICADGEDGIWVSSFATGEFIRIAPGGVDITDRIEVPGCIAITCVLGGADGATLYCSTYAGTPEDALSGKPMGRIETASVKVPAAAAIPAAAPFFLTLTD